MDIIQELWYVLRIFIALMLGFAIGVERKMRYKDAGIRTHAIVASGACLVMIVSKYGFSDVEVADKARVAAQIVSGIGFLGAGIIMHRRDGLSGLTTAAGIWMTAAIGMSVGAGMYIVALGATVMIIALQCILHIRIRFFQTKRYYTYRIKFFVNDDADKIKALFGVDNYKRINYYNTPEGLSASGEISVARIVPDEEIQRIISNNDSISAIERISQADVKE